MNNPQTKLVFSLFSDIFDPSSLTKLIGITPTNSWIKGDEVPFRKGVIRQESTWEFSIDISSMFFEEISKTFEDLFENHIDDIDKYRKENSLSIKFDIIVEIVEGRTPAFFINKKFLKLACKLEAELDVDIYVL